MAQVANPATMAREHPIIFSAPMVRAILSGAKTQTRRIVTPRPPDLTEEQLRRGQRYGLMAAPAAWGKPSRFIVSGDVQAVREHQTWLANHGIDCPYGAPGDRLWVRETFASERQEQAGTGAVRWLHPDGDRCGASYRADADREADHVRWKPAIHLPRCLSRITLEVTGVRVERLQAISEEDARAEGVQPLPIKGTLNGEPMTGMVFDPRMTFALLWDTINGKRASWRSNPWVWVVEFRRAG